MLKIQNLRVSYGAIKAPHGISLEVNAGEIVALIGSNGAGKSTLLNTISGLLRPVEGTIRFEDVRLEKTAPNEIVALGVCQVPEGRRILYSLTVLENLEMGAQQNAFQVLNIADRGYVLETGNIVLEQKAQELLNYDEVKRAYLGE